MQVTLQPYCPDCPYPTCPCAREGAALQRVRVHCPRPDRIELMEQLGWFNSPEEKVQQFLRQLFGPKYYTVGPCPCCEPGSPPAEDCERGSRDALRPNWFRSPVAGISVEDAIRVLLELQAGLEVIHPEMTALQLRRLAMPILEGMSQAEAEGRLVLYGLDLSNHE